MNIIDSNWLCRGLNVNAVSWLLAPSWDANHVGCSDEVVCTAVCCSHPQTPVAAAASLITRRSLPHSRWRRNCCLSWVCWNLWSPDQAVRLDWSILYLLYISISQSPKLYLWPSKLIFSSEFVIWRMFCKGCYKFLRYVENKKE